jgi:hypothetical protein
MISSSLRGMDSQTEKCKYNIVDFNDCVIILLSCMYIDWRCVDVIDDIDCFYDFLYQCIDRWDE